MQVVVNVLVAASTILLVAIGFSIIFSTSRFFHFAHGIVFTAGAYFTFLFKVWIGFPLFVSILLAVVLSAVLGILMHLFIYNPLHRKGSSPLILLLASLGIYIVVQNIISMVFGDGTKIIRSSVVKEGIDILGAKITPIQILIICVSVVLVISIAILLRKTTMGKAMRAVANDPELAGLSGISSNRIILLTFALGSALAGMAGILVALDIDMTPTMGMNALMMAVVAVIIGGVNSIPGVAMGAILLSLAKQLSIWHISSQWQDAIAFIILIIFLLIRPEGFMGKKIQKATV